MSFDLTEQIQALILQVVGPLKAEIVELKARIEVLESLVEETPDPAPEPAPEPEQKPKAVAAVPVPVPVPEEEALITTHDEARAHHLRHFSTFLRQKQADFKKPTSQLNSSDKANIEQQARRAYMAAYAGKQPNLVKLLTEVEAEDEFDRNSFLGAFYRKSAATEQRIRLKSLSGMSSADINAELILLTSYLETEKSGYRSDCLQAMKTAADKFHEKKFGEVKANTKWGQDKAQQSISLAYLRTRIYDAVDGDTFENKRVAELLEAINARLRTFARNTAPVTYPLNGHIIL